MANLVELSNDLEFVPKEQLIQMSQDPNSQYPSFLVLSEIQRRTQMEKMYDAQQPKPQTSVAEELVAEFADSPSGLGAMAQSSDLQQAFPSGDMSNMAPPSPMQMMASGGRTGYQVGGMSEQEMLKNQFLQSAGIGGGIESTLNNPMQEQITQEQKNFFKERYTKPDGSIDFGRAALDGFNAATLSMILAPEPTTTVVGGALRGIAGAGKGLFNLVRNPKQTIDKGLSAIGRLKSRITEGKRFNNPISKPQSTSNLPVPADKFKDMGIEVIKDVGPRIVGGAIIVPKLLPEGVEKEIDNKDATKSAEQLEIDRLNALLEEMRNKDSKTVDTSKDRRRNADLLIGLGGAIASARNVGELGSGISNAYRGVMADRAAVDQAGLQGRLLEAQISKIELEVANMPLNIAIKQYESLNDLVDSGVLTAEEAKIREAALMTRIQQLQGITVAEKSERDKLLGLTKVV